jgi:hypothetical protein
VSVSSLSLTSPLSDFSQLLLCTWTLLIPFHYSFLLLFFHLLCVMNTFPRHLLSGFSRNLVYNVGPTTCRNLRKTTMRNAVHELRVFATGGARYGITVYAHMCVLAHIRTHV